VPVRSSLSKRAASGTQIAAPAVGEDKAHFAQYQEELTSSEGKEADPGASSSSSAGTTRAVLGKLRLPKISKLFPSLPSAPRTQRSKQRPQSACRVLAVPSQSSTSSDVRSRSPRHEVASLCDSGVAPPNSVAELDVSAQRGHGRSGSSFRRHTLHEGIPTDIRSVSAKSGAASWKSEGDKDVLARKLTSGSTHIEEAVSSAERLTSESLRPAFAQPSSEDALPDVTWKSRASTSALPMTANHMAKQDGSDISVPWSYRSSRRTFATSTSKDEHSFRSGTPDFEEAPSSAVISRSAENRPTLSAPVDPSCGEGESPILAQGCAPMRPPAFTAAIFDQYYALALGGQAQTTCPADMEQELDDAIFDEAMAYDLGEELWGEHDREFIS